MGFGVPDFKMYENIQWEPRTPEKVTVFTADLRPCIIDGMEATFHRWADKSWIVPPSPVVGGHPGGVVRGVFAIVEMVDGSIREVDPVKVQFKTDAELFQRYCMGRWG